MADQFDIKLSTKTAEAKVDGLIKKVNDLATALDSTNKQVGAGARSATGDLQNLKKAVEATVSSAVIKNSEMFARTQRETAISVNRVVESTGRLVTSLDQVKSKVKSNADEVDKGNKKNKDWIKSLHSGNQATAAWRAGLNAAGANIGIFTSQTILAASAVYSLVAAFREMLTVGVEFTDMMVRVQAITGETAVSTAGMSQEVRVLASSTIFTAIETSDALMQLSMAGLSADEAMTALAPSLRLASIGLLSAGETADLVTNVMTQFKKEASDLPSIIDDLSTAVTSSNTNIQQLGNALSYVGPVAKAAGSNLEEVIAATSALASSGIKASRAGTGLRRIITNLTGPSKKVSDELVRLGVSTTDAAGNIRPLVDIFEDLKAAGLGAAEATTLVGVRQQAALLALTNNTEELKKLLSAIQDNDGAAKEFQKTIEDTLGADFKLLISAAQEKMLQFFDLNEAGFRELVQSTTEFIKSIDVTALNDFLTVTGKIVIGVAGAAAALGSLSLVIRGLQAALPVTTAQLVAAKIATDAYTVATERATLAGAAMSRLNPVILGITAVATAYWVLKDATDDSNTKLVTFRSLAGDLSAEARKAAAELDAMSKAQGRVVGGNKELSVSEKLVAEERAQIEASYKVAKLREQLAQAKTRPDSMLVRRGLSDSQVYEVVKLKKDLSDAEKVLMIHNKAVGSLNQELLDLNNRRNKEQEANLQAYLDQETKTREALRKGAVKSQAEISSALTTNVKAQRKNQLAEIAKLEMTAFIGSADAQKRRVSVFESTGRQIEEIYNGERGSITLLMEKANEYSKRINANNKNNARILKEAMQLEGEERAKALRQTKANQTLVASYLEVLEKIDKENAKYKSARDENRNKRQALYNQELKKGITLLDQETKQSATSTANLKGKAETLRNNIALTRLQFEDLKKFGLVTEENMRKKEAADLADLQATKQRKERTLANKQVELASTSVSDDLYKKRQANVEALKAEVRELSSVIKLKQEENQLSSDFTNLDKALKYYKGITDAAKESVTALSAQADEVENSASLARRAQRDIMSYGFVTSSTNQLIRESEDSALLAKRRNLDAQIEEEKQNQKLLIAGELAYQQSEKAITALEAERAAYDRLLESKKRHTVDLPEVRRNSVFETSGDNLVLRSLTPMEQISRKYEALKEKENEFFQNQKDNLYSSPLDWESSAMQSQKIYQEHQATIERLDNEMLKEQTSFWTSYASNITNTWSSVFQAIQDTHAQHNSVLVSQRKELVEELKEIETRDYSAQIVRMRELGASRSEIAASITATEKTRQEIMSDKSAEISAIDQQINAQHKAFEQAKGYNVAMAKMQIPLAFLQALTAEPGPPYTIPLAVGAAALATQQAASIQNTSLPRRQFGGPVQMGQPTVTNEAGPELFIPDKSGTIIPSDKLYRAMTEANNNMAKNQPDVRADQYVVTINVNAIDAASIASRGEEIASIVVNEIDKKRKRQARGSIMRV